MKFSCGKRRADRRRRRMNWHNWFAWYPVKVDYCDCRWLETVQRRWYDEYPGWDYRLPPEGPPACGGDNKQTNPLNCS